jgi:hypothetical protein
MEMFVEQKGFENNLYEVIKPLRGHKPTGKGLVIDNLEIANVTVHVNMPAIPGQTQSVDLKLASIQMVNLSRLRRGLCFAASEIVVSSVGPSRSGVT